MKTSTKQARNSRPALSRIVMALAVASVIGGVSMAPAFGQDNRDRRGGRDNGWHNDNRHDDRYWREHQRVYRPVYRHPYSYSQPVYAPPPVYYPPRPSPGFSLFFPLDIRVR